MSVRSVTKVIWVVLVVGAPVLSSTARAQPETQRTTDPRVNQVLEPVVLRHWTGIATRPSTEVPPMGAISAIWLAGIEVEPAQVPFEMVRRDLYAKCVPLVPEASRPKWPRAPTRIVPPTGRG